jgi:hypothetical protein
MIFRALPYPRRYARNQGQVEVRGEAKSEQGAVATWSHPSGSSMVEPLITECVSGANHPVATASGSDFVSQLLKGSRSPNAAFVLFRSS